MQTTLVDRSCQQPVVLPTSRNPAFKRAEILKDGGHVANIALTQDFHRAGVRQDNLPHFLHLLPMPCLFLPTPPCPSKHLPSPVSIIPCLGRIYCHLLSTKYFCIPSCKFSKTDKIYYIMNQNAEARGWIRITQLVSSGTRIQTHLGLSFQTFPPKKRMK